MNFKMSNFMILPIAAALLAACDTKPKTVDATIYKCDGLSLKAQTVDDKTILVSGMMGGKDIQMVRSGTEKGEVFVGSTEAGAEIVFVKNDDTATILSTPNAPINCFKLTANPAADLKNFKTIGHEPSWNIQFDDQTFSINVPSVIEQFSVPVGEFKLPEMKDGKTSVSFSYEETKLSFAIENKICQDPMSGQYHLYTTTMTYLGNTYNGCGFSMSDANQALIAM